jgi:hypothetical protein
MGLIELWAERNNLNFGDTGKSGGLLFCTGNENVCMN